MVGSGLVGILVGDGMTRVVELVYRHFAWKRAYSERNVEGRESIDSLMEESVDLISDDGDVQLDWQVGFA